MPEPTPEAWAQIRHAYEHTDKPLAHICADNDITIPMLRYRMKKRDWTRRKPLISRQGPEKVEFFSLPPVRAANGGEGSGVGGLDVLQNVEAPPPPRPPSLMLRRATLPTASRGEGRSK